MIEHLTFDHREAGDLRRVAAQSMSRNYGGGVPSKPKNSALVYVKIEHRLRPGVQVPNGGRSMVFLRLGVEPAQHRPGGFLDLAGPPGGGVRG